MQAQQERLQFGDEIKDDLEAGAVTLEWHIKELSIKHHRLLTDIAGRARTGELLLLLGPSGSGKTTLLECISLRNRGFVGALHFNGKPAGPDFLAVSAVVYQADVAHGFLTPREHLIFHGLARMSRSHSRAEIYRRVGQVITELSLDKCADTLIGGANPFFTQKGISGGERKRLMIATELLYRPQVLVLDEPTSGLDSTMADSVLHSLHKVTKHGTMVITSLHCPSSSWAPYFTNLLLLTPDGRMAYHGPYSKALEYFEGITYTIPKGTSTSEFLLKLVSREAADVTTTSAAPPKQEDDRVDRLMAEFRASPYSVKDPLPAESSRGGIRAFVGTHASTQMLMLLNAARCTLEVYRSGIIYALWALAHIISGVTFGVLFYGSVRASWRNMIGQIANVAFAVSIMGGIGTAIVFANEWPKLVREYLVGRNAAGPFVFGRSVAIMLYIPGGLGVPAVVYYMSGFVPQFREFLIFNTASVSVGVAAASVGLFASSFSTNILVGLVIVPAILLPMWNFAGVIYQKSAVPAYLEWLLTSSIYNYGFSALLGPQAQGLSPQDRRAALAFVGVDPNHWPQDLLALVGITACFFLLTYLSIRLRLLLLGHTV